MKLNNKQSLAIISYLLETKIISIETFEDYYNSFGQLFDDEAREIRVISKYGMAGKLWNNNNKIYITGWSYNEIKENDYNKQQKEVDKYNKDIEFLLNSYK